MGLKGRIDCYENSSLDDAGEAGGPVEMRKEEKALLEEVKGWHQQHPHREKELAKLLKHAFKEKWKNYIEFDSEHLKLTKGKRHAEHRAAAQAALAILQPIYQQVRA